MKGKKGREPKPSPKILRRREKFKGRTINNGKRGKFSPRKFPFSPKDLLPTLP